MKLAALLFGLVFAVPFWQAKECADWSEEELRDFMIASPWAQPAEAVALGGAGGVVTFLATSEPMQKAELELRRRRLPKGTNEEDVNWQEWREFLERDNGKYVVLAVAIPIDASRDGKEMAEMENQTVMKIGRRRIKMSGYFPPSASDPFTRLIYPRSGVDEAKEITFEMYVPGLGANFREAVYRLKDLKWKGKLAL